LCIEEIFRKYRLAKEAIGTQTLAQHLSPCPHKGLSNPKGCPEENESRGIVKDRLRHQVLPELNPAIIVDV